MSFREKVRKLKRVRIPQEDIKEIDSVFPERDKYRACDCNFNDNRTISLFESYINYMDKSIKLKIFNSDMLLSYLLHRQ